MGQWGRRIAAVLTTIATLLISPWLERHFAPDSNTPLLIAVVMLILASLFVWNDWFPFLRAAFVHRSGFQLLELPNPPPPEKYYCESSPRFAIFVPRKGQAAFFVPVEFEWDDARLLVQVVAPGDNSVLRGLTPSDEVIIGYKYHVALSQNSTKRIYTEGGELRCHIDFQIDRTDFRDAFELGGGSFREQRASILFLNESLPDVGEPPKDDENAMMDYVSTIMGQIEVQGLKGNVEKSPLPNLYKEFGRDPTLFLEIAWIHLVIDARIREVADEIKSLRLDLELPYVKVEFVAKNGNDELRINGKCQVA